MSDSLQAGFSCWKVYNAVKLHFSGTGYDYEKYGGKSPGKIDSFVKRRDKFQFINLSRRLRSDDWLPFFVANAVQNLGLPWIGNLLDDDSFNVHRDWRARCGVIERNFGADSLSLIRFVSKDPRDWVKPVDAYPPIAQLLMERRIVPETFVIVVHKLLDCGPDMDAAIEDKVLWPKWSKTMRAYSTFVQVETPRFARQLKTALDRTD